MPSNRLQMIRDLHAFTEVGLSDCKKALDTADGDYFQALCSLLTPEAFREKEQSFQVRSLAGDSILDPVTKEEAKLMDSLRAYFDDGVEEALRRDRELDDDPSAGRTWDEIKRELGR